MKWSTTEGAGVQPKSKHLFLALFCSMLAVFCVAVMAGCGGQAAEPAATEETQTEEPAVTELKTIEDGKLIVQSDLAYAPMEYVPEGKTSEDAEGFEVDLVNAIAEKLGLTVEWQQVQFDTIIPAVKQGGTVDMGASSFTITDERLEEIDFSDSYMDSNQGIVMTKAAAAEIPGFDASQDVAGTERLDAVKSVLDVAGVKVAVQSGTTGEAWSQENLTNAETVPLADAIQCLTGLQSGLYNAVIADYPVMAYYCQESYADLEVVAAIPTGEQYGLVISKDNPALTEAVNKALAELQEDGTLTELENKWFGSAS